MAASKPKGVFIVQYEIEDAGDPIKEFPTLETATTWIKQVIEDPYHEDSNGDTVDISTIKLYKGVLVGKAHVEVTFK